MPTQTPQPHFRLPTHLSPSPSPPFPKTNHHGPWHLLKTSNPFWTSKTNITTLCSPSGTDSFFYRTAPAGPVKTMVWKTRPVEGETATFASQGTGMMRFFGARWEVIGWCGGDDDGGEGAAEESEVDGEGEGGDERDGQGGKPEWMVAYQHKTLLTPAAINISCRVAGGIEEEDWQVIEGWLGGVEDVGFRKAVEGLFVVEHE